MEVLFYNAMNRTSFLIDGFNLYHSIKSASHDLGLKGTGTRWLDLRSMCSSYLHAIGSNAQIENIYYFSALAKHINAIDPNVTARHRTYIKCLEATGLKTQLARFKKKFISCDKCGQKVKRYEEKETDVAIAVKLLEIFVQNECDTAILVTGDTDIVPAVKTVRRLFPQSNIGFLLPYNRYNRELEQLVPITFKIKKETYIRHQFADPFITPKGKQINKPTGW